MHPSSVTSDMSMSIYIAHQRADERLSDCPPPKMDPGAFSGQSQG